MDPYYQAVDLTQDPQEPAQPQHFAPNPQMFAQLAGLGFNKNAVTRGLYFTGNMDAELAAAWIIEHEDDPNVNSSLTGEPEGADDVAPFLDDGDEAEYQAQFHSMGGTRQGQSLVVSEGGGNVDNLGDHATTLTASPSRSATETSSGFATRIRDEGASKAPGSPPISTDSHNQSTQSASVSAPHDPARSSSDSGSEPEIVNLEEMTVNPIHSPTEMEKDATAANLSSTASSAKNPAPVPGANALMSLPSDISLLPGNANASTSVSSNNSQSQDQSTASKPRPGAHQVPPQAGLHSADRAICLHDIQQEEEFSGNLDEPKMVFVVNDTLAMGPGKMAAQVAHAAVLLYGSMQELQDPHLITSIFHWMEIGMKKIVLKSKFSQRYLANQLANSPNTTLQGRELLRALFAQARASRLPAKLISDAGRTQVPSGSITVLAIFGTARQVDPITGGLALL